MANFINPTPGAKVTSEFGLRKDPKTGKANTMHRGIDTAKAGKVNILASASGTVLRAGVIGTYGQTIVIRHSINGKRQDTVYAHLRAGSLKVKVGDKVKQGQVIALMGSTGKSTGQHLHFEIHEGAWTTGQPNARNPRNYVNFNSTSKSTTSPKPVAKKKYTSLVDYLASKGKPTSFSERAKLASKYGIKNYKGTAVQNTALLDILQK